MEKQSNPCNDYGCYEFSDVCKCLDSSDVPYMRQANMQIITKAANYHPR